MLGVPPGSEYVFTVAVVLAMAVLCNIIIAEVCNVVDEYKADAKRRIERLDGRK